MECVSENLDTTPKHLFFEPEDEEECLLLTEKK